MIKALVDFEEDGVPVKAGDEITLGMFEADRMESLVSKGYITDPGVKKPAKVAKNVVAFKDDVVEDDLPKGKTKFAGVPAGEDK